VEPKHLKLAPRKNFDGLLNYLPQKMMNVGPKSVTIDLNFQERHCELCPDHPLNFLTGKI